MGFCRAVMPVSLISLDAPWENKVSQYSFITWLFLGELKIAGLICKDAGKISNLFQIMTAILKSG